MTTYWRKVDKDPINEVSSWKEEEEAEVDTPGPIYDDTLWVIFNDNSFHLGEIFDIFTKHTFPQLPEGFPDLGKY